MWPAFEMPGMAKVMRRFSRINPPSPDCMMLMPRSRWIGDHRAEQPEDRSGRADGEDARVVEHHGEAAGQQGRHVERQVAPVAEHPLELVAHQPQHQHVHADVDDAGVQERPREQPVPLAPPTPTTGEKRLTWPAPTRPKSVVAVPPPLASDPPLAITSRNASALRAMSTCVTQRLHVEGAGGDDRAPLGRLLRALGAVEARPMPAPCSSGRSDVRTAGRRRRPGGPGGGSRS